MGDTALTYLLVCRTYCKCFTCSEQMPIGPLIFALVGPATTPIMFAHMHAMHHSKLVSSVQQSRSFLRKYCGALDIILSMTQQLCGSLQVCCINRQPHQAVQALKAHQSQYVWYDGEHLLSFDMRAAVTALIVWLRCLQVPATVHQAFLLHICEFTVQAGTLAAATTSNK